MARWLILPYIQNFDFQQVLQVFDLIICKINFLSVMHAEYFSSHPCAHHKYLDTRYDKRVFMLHEGNMQNKARVLLMYWLCREDLLLLLVPRRLHIQL